MKANMRSLIFAATMLPVAAHAQYATRTKTLINVVPGQPWCMEYRDVEGWRIDPHPRIMECQRINGSTILNNPGGEQDFLIGQFTNSHGVTHYQLMITGPLADPGKEAYVWVPRSSFIIPNR